MKTSLKLGDFTKATIIARATFLGLVTAVLFLSSSCDGQETDGIDRLLLKLQQIDLEHNSGPCTTGSNALTTASDSSNPVVPLRVDDADISPVASTNNDVDQSAQEFGSLTPVVRPDLFGSLTPVVRPEAFGLEPIMPTQFDGSQYGFPQGSGFPQESGHDLISTPASFVSSSTSTRPLTVSKASSLWTTYCNDDDLAPTSCGSQRACRCRGH